RARHCKTPHRSRRVDAQLERLHRLHDGPDERNPGSVTGGHPVSGIVKNMVVLDKAAGTKYRVLEIVDAAGIDQDDAKRYVIPIELDIDKAPMPHAISHDEMLEHLASREWAWVEDDHVSIDLNSLSEGERKILEFRWG